MAKRSPPIPPKIAAKRPEPRVSSSDVEDAINRFFSAPPRTSRTPPPVPTKVKLSQAAMQAKPEPEPRRENPNSEGSVLSSIPVDLGDLEAELSQNAITIDNALAHLNAEKLFALVAKLCVKLQPKLEDKPISFEMFGMQIGDEAFGDLQIEEDGLKLTISLAELGYSDITEFPISTIINQFATNRNLFAALINNSSEVAIVAVRKDGQDSIELCLYGKTGKPLTKFQKNPVT